MNCRFILLCASITPGVTCSAIINCSIDIMNVVIYYIDGWVNNIEFAAVPAS